MGTKGPSEGRTHVLELKSLGSGAVLGTISETLAKAFATLASSQGSRQLAAEGSVHFGKTTGSE